MGGELGEREQVKTGDPAVPACWLGFLWFAKKRCVEISWILGRTWVRMAAGYMKRNDPCAGDEGRDFWPGTNYGLKSSDAFFFFSLPFLIRTFNPRKSVLHRNTLHGGLLGGISLSVSQRKSCGWR